MVAIARRLIVAAVLVAATGCGDSGPETGSRGPAQLPGNYAEIIAEESDCDELQAIFDQAERTGQARRDDGDFDTAEGYTAVMERADERMREVGCY